MSAYKVVECEVNSEDHIVAGLVDMGISLDQIETHKNAVPLRNWRGSETGQRGNVVVRRENFRQHTQKSYNADLGFERTDSGYKMHINSEENSWWKQKEPRFKQVAATMEVTAQAKKRGYHIRKVEKDGKIRLSLTKNF